MGLTGPVQLYVLRLTDEIVVCDAVVVQLVMGLGRCIFWPAGESNAVVNIVWVMFVFQ